MSKQTENMSLSGTGKGSHLPSLGQCGGGWLLDKSDSACLCVPGGCGDWYWEGVSICEEFLSPFGVNPDARNLCGIPEGGAGQWPPEHKADVPCKVCLSVTENQKAKVQWGPGWHQKCPEKWGWRCKSCPKGDPEDETGVRGE